MGTARPSFDVAIVGGGPAGSSTALHLVRAMGVSGARVVVLDRAVHPRDKPCGGALSAWGVDALRRIGVDIMVPHVVVRGVRILLGEEVGETRAPGMAGPGGPTGPAVFAGAEGAPQTRGVEEVDVKVADDGAGEAG